MNTRHEHFSFTHLTLAASGKVAIENDANLVDFARGPFLTSYNIDASANITSNVLVSYKDLDNDDINDAVLILAPPVHTHTHTLALLM